MNIDLESETKYINLEQINTTDSSVPINLQTNLVTPLMMKPNEYSASIIRFSIPLLDVGYFTFQDGAYKVTMSYKGEFFTQTVTFVPRSYDTAIRSIYEIDHFVALVNQAFIDCMTGLSLLIVLPSGAAYPFIDYDIETKKFNLIVSKTYFENSLTDPIKIYFNDPLFLKIGISMPAYNLNSNVYKYQILCQDNHGFNTILIDGLSDTFLNVSQEANTFDVMSDFSGIVITTSIPIRNEIVGNTSSMLPIFTDFQKSDMTIDTFRNSCTYSAITNYRCVDILGQSPLSNFQFGIFSKSTLGVITPITLPSGCICTLKVMFQKKH